MTVSDLRQQISQAEAQLETEFFDSPHVVLIRDPVVGTMPRTAIGPFPTVIEALDYADRIRKDLHEQWGSEPPLEVSVSPLMPPEIDPNTLTV